MAKRRATRKVSKSTAKFRTALIRLKKLKPHHQCMAMKMANNGFIRQMCTHIKKLRYKKLKGKQAKAVKRHAQKLKTLADSKVSLRAKRRLLSQRGGFLSMIAPVLMSAIGPAIRGISNLISGK